MIPHNEKYFNLIEHEWFFVESGPIAETKKEPYYLVQWEDGTNSKWNESEIIRWLDDTELNIKIKDEKHLLLLKLKHSDKVY